MNVVQLLKICIGAAFFGTLLTGAVFMIRSSDEADLRQHAKGIVFQSRHVPDDDKESSEEKQDSVPVKLPKPELKTATSTSAKTTSTSQPTTATVTVKPEVLKELKESSRTTSIHVFYYPWYGNPDHDSQWYHWNHPRLPPWDRSQAGKFPTDPHIPPGDVASTYYPSLGPYSSRDPSVIDKHMKWIASAGIDVVVVSWYPKGMADEQGYPWDDLMPALLNATAKNKLKLAFHLEPYKQRTVESVRNDIEYILTNYGSHPSFYRTSAKTDTKHTKELPLFYIYDSYRISAEQWDKLTSPNGTLSIRDTPLDSLLIGLYVQMEDRFKLRKGGFDGLYTYFASDGFSHGSTMANWPSLSTYCAKNGLLFIPSVGPGYNDTQVRPWNDANSRGRGNGDYYKEHFKMAHTSKADIVSITSFNEWHEGTQIEPAVPFTDANGTDFVYAQYNKTPEQYLEITLEMVKTYFTPHHENIAERVERIV